MQDMIIVCLQIYYINNLSNMIKHEYYHGYYACAGSPKHMLQKGIVIESQTFMQHSLSIPKPNTTDNPMLQEDLSLTQMILIVVSQQYFFF